MSIIWLGIFVYAQSFVLIECQMNTFTEITTWVGDPSVTLLTGSIIECAIECQLMSGFGFVYSEYQCTIYHIVGHCDQILEPNVIRINVIDTERQKLNILQRSFRFNILRNVNKVNNNPNPSVLRSVNENVTQAILNFLNGYTGIMAGTFNNGRALAFYKEECITTFFSLDYVTWSPNLYTNMAKWLTHDACTNFSSCTFHINNYKSYLRKDNQIVIFPQAGITANVSDPYLLGKVNSGSWGVIFAGTYWHFIKNEHRTWMNNYGICPTNVTNYGPTSLDLNWCTVVPQTTNVKCG